MTNSDGEATKSMATGPGLHSVKKPIYVADHSLDIIYSRVSTFLKIARSQIGGQMGGSCLCMLSYCRPCLEVGGQQGKWHSYKLAWCQSWPLVYMPLLDLKIAGTTSSFKVYLRLAGLRSDAIITPKPSKEEMARIAILFDLPFFWYKSEGAGVES